MHKQCIPLLTIPEMDHERYSHNIRKALLGAFFSNVAMCSEEGKSKGSYVLLQDTKVAEKHPSCCLDYKPQWVMYHEVMLTKKHFLRSMTTIRPEWCFECAPKYFSQVEFPISVSQKEMERLKESWGARLNETLAASEDLQERYMHGVLQAQKDLLANKEAEELQRAGLQVLGADVQPQQNGWQGGTHGGNGGGAQGYHGSPQYGYQQGGPPPGAEYHGGPPSHGAQGFSAQY